jgi:hypothetical protein
MPIVRSQPPRVNYVLLVLCYLEVSGQLLAEGAQHRWFKPVGQQALASKCAWALRPDNRGPAAVCAPRRNQSHLLKRPDHAMAVGTARVISSLTWNASNPRPQVVLWTACLLSSSTAHADSVAGHGYLQRETVGGWRAAPG